MTPGLLNRLIMMSLSTTGQDPLYGQGSDSILISLMQWVEVRVAVVIDPRKY